MTKEEFFKSAYFRVLFPLAAIALALTLLRQGIEFGRWLAH